LVNTGGKKERLKRVHLTIALKILEKTLRRARRGEIKRGDCGKSRAKTGKRKGKMESYRMGKTK